MTQTPMRVLFLCTGNSARSQIAEAILRHLSHGRIEVFSAGSTPASEVHPMALTAIRSVVREEMQGQYYPKAWHQFVGQRFDFIITVCDRAAEVCPTFPEDPERIHWSCEDPTAVEGSEEQRQKAFDTVAKQLVGRMRIWMALPRLRQAIELETRTSGEP